MDLVRFKRGKRKDERTKEYLCRWPGGEGVLYIGKAQECARVLRTVRRHDPATGAAYPWLADTTAMVNHYYVYLVDEDFGPLFVKFCSYFPYNAKVCLNGHEYVKRQLAKRGIGFEALDNAVARCDDPEAMQAIARGVTAETVPEHEPQRSRRYLAPIGAGISSGFSHRMTLLMKRAIQRHRISYWKGDRTSAYGRLGPVSPPTLIAR